MRPLASFVKGHWQLLVLAALLFALWDTDYVWPLRVMIVLFHELSHAGIALLTGGEVLELTINRREGGQVSFRGGSYIWTAMAGYLGSLFIGVCLFLMGVHTRLDRYVTIGLGLIILLTTVLFVREWFAIAFMTVTAVALIAMGWKLPRQISDLFLRLIGLVSMLYVPWDIAVDTIFTGNRTSLMATDAQAIAYQLGLTEKIVGVLWVIVALTVTALTLRFALRSPSNLVFRSTSDLR
ncbi:M50 family metallopeptidase [Octadecabacter sp. CECT 8868]|uniref:M50 family metallopeptidase n=1 Tax=Octadecabacter algicola TaxID=2909342 RepID=UPI001F2A46E4|nr:M50 family metallopeptidase [Octadecabacter algicola]MCF2906468.1 M50 family metallopeptidase [Octadecabacter algicola]